MFSKYSSQMARILTSMFWNKNVSVILEILNCYSSRLMAEVLGLKAKDER